jgi:uncharacterized repeat protein (TIGR03803 family)
MMKGSQVRADRGFAMGKQESHLLVAFALTVYLVVIPVQLVQAQTFTVLHTFTGGTDGGMNPSVGARDAAGNLYGVAREGGDLGCSVHRSSGCGVVFGLDANGKETVLFAFNLPGAIFPGSLIRHAVSNLYGVAGGGGRGLGTVFKVTTNGQEKVLHAFQGGIDGESPSGNLVVDSAGNIFGTTLQGGTGTWGTVFKIHGTRENVLYSFTGGADGKYPGGLTIDASGNLYGTAVWGGANMCNGVGCGVVYKVSSTGGFTVLHSFSGTDGAFPTGSLAKDKAGNLYGAAAGGGNDCEGSGCGTIFKLSTKGKLTTLHKFSGTDGLSPNGGLVRDAAGNIYGTTFLGGGTDCGSFGCGVVFKLDKTGKLTVLHSFTGADGSSPSVGLLRDPAGNLYGSTETGGGTGCGGSGCGVVFKITP